MDIGFAMAVATSFMLKTSHLLSSEGARFAFKVFMASQILSVVS